MKRNDVALLRPVLSDNGEINENARAVARLKKTDGRDVVSVSICGLPKRSGGDYYFFLEGNIPPFFQIFDTSGGEFSVYDRNAAGATAIGRMARNRTERALSRLLTPGVEQQRTPRSRRRKGPLRPKQEHPRPRRSS